MGFLRELVRRLYQQPEPLQFVQVLVITILDVEFHAAHHVLLDGKGKHIEREGLDYRIGELRLRDPKKSNLKVAIACVGSPGLTATTSVCNRSASVMRNLELIMLCGIAGGRARPDDVEKHVRLGDIVIGIHTPVNVIYGKMQGSGSFQPSAESLLPPDSRCRRIAQELKRSSDSNPRDEPRWERYRKEAVVRLKEWGVMTPCRNSNWDIPDAPDELFEFDDDGKQGSRIEHPADEFRRTYPDRPVVHCGLIASGDFVNKSPKVTRDQHSRPDLNQAIAYEMESSGVARAATDHDVPYFVVRGIVDYQTPRKNDEWHPTGALRAAAMGRCILESRGSRFEVREKSHTDRAVSLWRAKFDSELHASQLLSPRGSSAHSASPADLEGLISSLQSQLDLRDKESVLSLIEQLESSVESGVLSEPSATRVRLAIAHALVICKERSYMPDDEQTSRRIATQLAALEGATRQDGD